MSRGAPRRRPTRQQRSAAAPTSTAITGDVTVFAAASLKSTFTELGTQFEKDNPGTKVTFNFAGSSDLVAQLTQGAPGRRVRLRRHEEHDQGRRCRTSSPAIPVNFATNTLTIVTPPGNPKGIKTFADLAKPGTQVVVCAPQVPCGSATEKVEKATGVTLSPVSEESAVTDVLGKITSGQADAGLVYVTDAKGAGDKVTAIAVPGVQRCGQHLPDRGPQGLDEPRRRAEVRRAGDRPAGPERVGGSGFRRVREHPAAGRG